MLSAIVYNSMFLPDGRMLNQDEAERDPERNLVCCCHRITQKLPETYVLYVREKKLLFSLSNTGLALALI